MVSAWVPWYLRHSISSMRFSHRFVIRLRMFCCCTQYPASVLVLRLRIRRLTHIVDACGPLILRRKAWIHILVQAGQQSLLRCDAAAVFVRKLLGILGALLIFCQAFTAIEVVLAPVKIHHDLLLLCSINDMWHCVQILWLQGFRLYRSIFLSFVHRSWILVSNVLVAWVHEGSLFDALRSLVRERVVQPIERTVEELCLLFSIVWSSCSYSSHEILWNLVLCKYRIIIFPIDNWFWMVGVFSLILVLQNIPCSIKTLLVGWLRAVSLKISLIEFLMWDSIALRWSIEYFAIMRRILFAVLIDTVDSSSSWLLGFYRPRIVSIRSFLPRVRWSMSIKLRCILFIIACLFKILWRRSSRAPERWRRAPIIIWHNDVVHNVFKSSCGILLRRVLRRQATSRFTLLQLSLFQFCQVRLLS